MVRKLDSVLHDVVARHIRRVDPVLLRLPLGIVGPVGLQRFCKLTCGLFGTNHNETVARLRGCDLKRVQTNGVWIQHPVLSSASCANCLPSSTNPPVAELFMSAAGVRSRSRLQDRPILRDPGHPGLPSLVRQLAERLRGKVAKFIPWGFDTNIRTR